MPFAPVVAVVLPPSKEYPPTSLTATVTPWTGFPFWSVTFAAGGPLMS